MKKIIIMVIALIAIQITTFGKCYQVFKRNGQVNPGGGTTYEKVIEGDEPVGGKWQLDCNSPGSLVCKYKDGYTPPIIVSGNPIDINEAIELVQEQIMMGVLNGSVDGDGGIGYYSWNATSADDCEIEFCDGN